MRILILIIGILIQTVFASAADARVQLREITKQEGLDTTRLALRFSQVPVYRLETSGQRVDLFLSDTEGDSSLTSLPEDGKVVRILLGQQEQLLLTSFLLRTVPENVKVLTSKGSDELVLELYWGDHRSPARLAIASKLRGVPTVQADGTTIRLGEGTGYREEWRQFFSGFETPLVVPLPLQYTLPPLPLVLYQPLTDGAAGAELLAGLEESQAGRWDAALVIFKRIPVDQLQGVDREAFEVFYGEALVRSNNSPLAKGVLERFLESYPDSVLRGRVRYLLGYVCALSGHPYEAAYQLSLLNKEAGEKEYYRQIGGLMQAEIDLATGQPEKSIETLETSVFPQSVAGIRTRRLADAFAAVGRSSDALRLYRQVEKEVSNWSEVPRSLSLLAEVLYREKEYAESVRRYTDLLNLVEGDEGKSLALFAQGRGKMRSGDFEAASILLQNVTNYWPDTEGSRRAQLLLLDQEVLADLGGHGEKAIPLLSEISLKAASREIREEAAFKRLLLNIVTQPGLDSIKGCEGFLRQYGQGRYKVYAEGLLNEILPQVIGDLIAAEEYLDALVVVEKHRHRLVAGAANQSFLQDLCSAFRRLGLLDKAANVYFYMLDAYQGQPAEEPFYLPLVQVLDQQGDARLALEYADRYLARYPAGGDRSGILFLKVEALNNQGRNEEAAKILTSDGLPQTLELDLLAGKVFQSLNQPEQVEFFLSRALVDQTIRQAHPAAAIWLAESLFQLKKWGRAWSLYQELLANETFSDQARYRSAQILLIQEKKDEALKILQLLVEEGKNPQWQKVAESALLSEQTKEL